MMSAKGLPCAGENVQHSLHSKLGEKKNGTMGMYEETIGELAKRGNCKALNTSRHGSEKKSQDGQPGKKDRGHNAGLVVYPNEPNAAKKGKKYTKKKH